MPPQSTQASAATAATPQPALTESRQPLQPIPANITRVPGAPPVRKKPGPKPKSLLDRKAVDKLVKRQQRSYSRENKVQVLTFLLHHKVVRVPLAQQRRRRQGSSEADAILSVDLVAYRDVTLEEAAAFFKIPPDTVGSWWARREAILQETTVMAVPGGQTLRSSCTSDFRSVVKHGLSQQWDGFVANQGRYFLFFTPKTPLSLPSLGGGLPASSNAILSQDGESLTKHKSFQRSYSILSAASSGKKFSLKYLFSI
ncbi:hypothetical protein C8A05DRAFT_19382 [Staphylotrichum tortipilum]|uniref:Uncharacterized protein n=1 Tax=Staphylotrichum tortipilum TaxID=2831512 RepID=A0AAN6RPF7_9PEZI|nr:hypothetical protein C8A05DRAFT_19382 [Staphylotrichum longicolle]